ncbi:secondary thiamine-phosphate synthase [Dolosicoccus paucivorans]|uniref:Secondary thiamine-phosphate synthase n=1 Tax=Dolosicoccus paucivorans TaxID=84521 RepID=A0A2N6SPH4_9LACT|nr:YjbQ family protein [Dolosicoccus paucivorans]PMC58974.1 secondary thiamine-phosphate synthase [Dolosicoccus paucivorans]
MNIFHETLQVRTVSGRPSYHDLQEKVKKVVNDLEVSNGICVITTPHTTCSLYYDETMHDTNYFGDEYLQVDINEMMEKIIPQMKTEGDYHSPGEEHIKFGLSLSDPNYPAEKWVMLNTDAHLRASVYGSNSVTLIIQNGSLLTGELGRVYFVDWDQLRERERTINILVMGQ